MVLTLMPNDGLSESTANLVSRRSAPCLVVLDRHFNVLSHEPRLRELCEHAGMSACDGLPEPIVTAVRTLVTESGGALAANADAAVIVPGLLVRSCLLDGPSDICIAVTIEPLRARDPLRRTAVRYRLTRREQEVLSLILDGLEAREIAERLHIAETTVGEYFKHLYLKIGVNNRSGMLARVFEWPESGA